MKLSKTANVVDVEHDNGRLIEIGLTMVNIEDRKILQTYSLPIKPEFELSSEVAQLTGWSTAKLIKQGITKEEASRRLMTYGFANRLLVSDASDEIPFLEESFATKFSSHRLNVSILFFLLTGNDINVGLETMLAKRGLQFEGRLHSGADDSKNIARLFLNLLPEVPE